MTFEAGNEKRKDYQGRILPAWRIFEFAAFPASIPWRRLALLSAARLMGAFNSRTEATRDDWQTPIEIVRALGDFDLDPCANVLEPSRCAQFGLTEFDDGLNTPWLGRVFLNPPYGNAAKMWIERLAKHGNGIALVPPRMGAGWFHRLVLKTADAILFLEGRVDFIDPRTGKAASLSINPTTGKPFGGSNMDSCLIAWGTKNVEALKTCGLPGMLWIIR